MLGAQDGGEDADQDGRTDVANIVITIPSSAGVAGIGSDPSCIMGFPVLGEGPQGVPVPEGADPAACADEEDLAVTVPIPIDLIWNDPEDPNAIALLVAGEPVYLASADTGINRYSVGGITLDFDFDADDSTKDFDNHHDGVGNGEGAPLYIGGLGFGGDGMGLFADGNALYLDELFIGDSDLDDDGFSDVAEIISCGSNPFNPASHCENFDGDPASNEQEAIDGTDERDPNDFLTDTDGGGYLDNTDNCPLHPNGPNDGPNDQTNTYTTLQGGETASTERGDVCDDTDGDGLFDYEEQLGLENIDTENAFGGRAHGPSHGFGATDPTKADTDGDGIADNRELKKNTNGSNVGSCGGSNTDPKKVDTDGDGLTDAQEVGTDGCQGNAASGETNAWSAANSDGDGLTDLEEYFGLKPGTAAPGATPAAGFSASDFASGDFHGFGKTNGRQADDDEDGLNDDAEVTGSANDYCTPYSATPMASGTDTRSNTVANGACAIGAATTPKGADSDGDGVKDGAEVNTHGTDPNNPDTDGDGFTDGQEIGVGCRDIDFCEIGVGIEDPTYDSRSDPRDPDSTPEPFDPTSGVIDAALGAVDLAQDIINTGIATVVGTALGALMPECDGTENAPEYCEVENPLDQRDHRDTDPEKEADEPNGDLDLIEERLFWLEDSNDADLDVWIVEPTISIGGSIPDPIGRLGFGDYDADDDVDSILFAYGPMVTGVCIATGTSELGGPALALITGGSLEDPCSGEITSTDIVLEPTDDGAGLRIRNGASQGGATVFEFYIAIGENPYDTVVYVDGESLVLGPDVLQASQNEDGEWGYEGVPESCEPVIGDPTAGDVDVVCETTFVALPGQTTDISQLEEVVAIITDCVGGEPPCDAGGLPDCTDEGNAEHPVCMVLGAGGDLPCEDLDIPDCLGGGGIPPGTLPEECDAGPSEACFMALIGEGPGDIPCSDLDFPDCLGGEPEPPVDCEEEPEHPACDPPTDPPTDPPEDCLGEDGIATICQGDGLISTLTGVPLVKIKVGPITVLNI